MSVGAVPKLITVNVTTAGTRVPLSVASLKFKYALIQAKKNNTGDVYVGDKNVSSSNGVALSSYATMPLTVYSDLASMYIDAGSNGDGVNILIFD